MNDGGPAFPNPVERSQGDFGTTDAYPGMSLRDWFAGQAIAAVVATAQAGGLHAENMPGEWEIYDAAGWAYDFADAMLAARSNNT